jgi:hypothetical protein
MTMKRAVTINCVELKLAPAVAAEATRNGGLALAVLHSTQSLKRAARHSQSHCARSIPESGVLPSASLL